VTEREPWPGDLKRRALLRPRKPLSRPILMVTVPHTTMQTMSADEARREGEAWGQAATELALRLLDRSTSDEQAEAVVRILLRTLSERIESFAARNGKPAAAAFQEAATKVISASFASFSDRARAARSGG
jgi:hypothetical protein